MKRILLILLLIGVLIVAGYQVLKFQYAPNYAGNTVLEGLSAETEVYFDKYGIPHIYAGSAGDAYLTLGYLHAQDRLFQMELMRRVGTGRMAELLGEELLDTDKFFRTLGIPQHAEQSTSHWHKQEDSEWKKATEAYLMGVNKFISNGKLPLEFALLGAKPEPFTINDMYGIIGYMSFTFGMALKTDPLVTKMARELGPEYLEVLSVHTLPAHHIIPNHYPERDPENRQIEIKGSLTTLLEKLPIPMWMGSNAWVIAPERTSSGEVLFCNDTHIGFSQPSVWYEAHLEYPGFSFYGNHLAGIPFALVGHSRHHSTGLTMFENDDQDFYEEKLNPINPDETIYGDTFQPIHSRKDTILVKDKDPEIIEIRETVHGPIINEVIPEISRLTEDPVASWWVYLLQPSQALEALWRLNHGRNIQDVEEGVRLIHAPGLNVMYGDKSGNIAWWAAAKLPKRPEHVNSKIFLDGTDPADEPTGWIPFEENPMSINPPAGFVATANNQPDTLSNGRFYPGYYYPGARYDRIAKTIGSRTDWNQENVKTLQLETINEILPQNAKILLDNISQNDYPEYRPILNALASWSGDHGLKETAPTLYYKWIYHTLYLMMADELGEEDFEVFLKTFIALRSTHNLLQAGDSPWWNNIATSEKESRKDIIQKAFDISISELSSQLGRNSEEWFWEESVRITHNHALGSKKPLDKIYNVSTKAVPANEESVNKMAFDLNGEGIYQVKSGPAMRIIIDFADVEASESINPTGQSGNIFSPWYKDQADLFVSGQYRPQLMNRQMIKDQSISKLLFKSPE